MGYIYTMENPNQEILNLVHQHFPELSELPLQKEIASVGVIHHFEGGQIIMNFGSYIKLVPLLVKGSIKVEIFLPQSAMQTGSRPSGPSLPSNGQQIAW